MNFATNVSSGSFLGANLKLNKSINLAGGVGNFLVMVGIVAKPTTSENIINIQNTIYIVNSSCFYIKITSTSSTPTYIGAIYYFLFAYNNDFFQSTNYFKFYPFSVAI